MTGDAYPGRATSPVEICCEIWYLPVDLWHPQFPEYVTLLSKAELLVIV